MHGVLKVRTSAEKQAALEAQREQIAESYISLQDKIFAKRNAKCYDSELLDLTEQILRLNPDVVTMWNIRKETIISLEEKNNLKNNTDDSDSSDDSDFETIMECKENLQLLFWNDVVKREFEVIENALRINAKSYGAWYQRCWLLKRYSKEELWNRELKLCTRYLELDERNFHCWCYRKFIVENGDISLTKELEYATNKVMNSVSNYSAWHYRSTLIPKVHPHPTKLMNFNAFKEEISLFENSIYTAPNDESAWLHQSWLFSYYDVAPLKIISAGYAKDVGLAWMCVNKPPKGNVHIIGIECAKWTRFQSNIATAVFDLFTWKNSDGAALSITDDEFVVIHSVKLRNATTYCEGGNPFPTHYALNSKEEHSLLGQLVTFEDLHELEPNNKYIILAILAANDKLDKPLDFSLIEKLQKIDPGRENYYKSLRDRYLLREELSKHRAWCENLSLRLNLTTLHHTRCFTNLKRLHLNNNPLGNAVLPLLQTLFECQFLTLNNCGLTSLREFPILPKLSRLELCDNAFNDKETDVPGVELCYNLNSIHIFGSGVERDSPLHKKLCLYRVTVVLVRDRFVEPPA